MITYFSHIGSRKELANRLGIPLRKLTYLVYGKGIDNLYSSFEIQKKNGKMRSIDAPHDELKDVQQAIRVAIEEHELWLRGNLPNRKKTLLSHAFEKTKSIITNAYIHRNKRYVYNIDLKDFFNTIHFGRVLGFFENNNNYSFSHEAAVLMAQLTCFKGRLPQGAPSSPIITNLICSSMDYRIYKLAKSYRTDYTRYADDLTFSTNDKRFLDSFDAFTKEIERAINQSGFQINQEKTRLSFMDSRQEVTGLVVNHKLAVRREYYKDTRAMAHHLYRNGEFHINGCEATINQLEGRLAFIDQIDRYNNRMLLARGGTLKEHVLQNARENEYKKFLVYKLFLHAEKPLIITEGKTDITYLKSAIKSLQPEYSEFGTYKQNGEFEFSINFLKRSDRIEYFLGIHKDGADAMTNLCREIFGVNPSRKSEPPVLKMFKEKYGKEPKGPTLFLFDNELETQRPARKFIEILDLKDKKQQLKENCWIKIEQGLYMIVSPLVDDMKETEIEDLFEQSVLNTVIGGKTFSRDKEYDNKKNYGKAVFADYISKNYKGINFERFRTMLDAMRDAVNDWRENTSKKGE